MRRMDPQVIPNPGLKPPPLAGFPHIDLEIGAGQGLHAIQYAQANPLRMLIAIEKTHTRYQALSRRAQNHQLNNLMPIHADAVNFAVHCLPPASLERVFLLYPNPYEKRRNLRWYNRPALACILDKMKPGAHLIMATNLEWYAREAEKYFTENWALRLVSIMHPTQARTHFELKYLQRGERCWNLTFQVLPIPV